MIHRHLAGSATVQESEELTHRVTGRRREVDVVIRAQVAGHEVVVGVEATMKRGTTGWVEQMLGKHAELPTDRLVLVAERGFDVPARQLAEAKGAAVIAPEELSAADAGVSVISKITHATPIALELVPREVVLQVQRSGGRLRKTSPDVRTPVLRADGSAIVSLSDLVMRTLRRGWGQARDSVDLSDPESATHEFKLNLGGKQRPMTHASDGLAIPVYLDEGDGRGLSRIVSVRIAGDFSISAARLPLQHRRFGDTLVAHGETDLGGRRALVVVTEHEHDARLSVRVDADADADRRVDAAAAAPDGWVDKSGQYVQVVPCRSSGGPASTEELARELEARMAAAAAASRHPEDEPLPILLFGTDTDVWCVTFETPATDEATEAMLETSVPSMLRAAGATCAAIALVVWGAPNDRANPIRPRESPLRQELFYWDVVAADGTSSSGLAVLSREGRLNFGSPQQIKVRPSPGPATLSALRRGLGQPNA